MKRWNRGDVHESCGLFPDGPHTAGTDCVKYAVKYGDRTYAGNCEKCGAVSCACAVADPVNHPPHYTSHPSGVECIQVTEHLNFCIGNAIKYLWRADDKGDALENLRKARWYVDREIARRETAES